MGEDGIEDSLHAGSIGEAAHGSGSSSEFSGPPFDEVGGADLLPQGGVLSIA